MKFNRIFVAAAVAVIAAGCVKEQVGDVDLPVEDEVVVVEDAPKLIAELDEPETRTCIDADANATGKLSMLWTPSDEVGVFTSGGNKNVKYVNDEKSVNVPNASFSATSTVNGNIQYVYYPYSSANNGKEATALSGTVPAEQVMGQSIAGDYKYGTLKSMTEDGGYKFKFNNMFSLVRFNIDATGTALADATLETVTLTVTRNGATVPVAGDFTFSAVDGTYTLGTTSDVLTTVWNKPLQGNQSSYASIFPNVKKGDKLNFVIKAGDFESTLTVTATADFAAGKYYNFPLTLSKFSALKIKKVKRGNVTAATYNVDGMPNLSINLILYKFELNPDGPGESGTASIAQKIKGMSNKWDMISLSEDFEYHNTLANTLTEYTFGKHRGSISAKNAVSRADTDGLGFATLNSTCTFLDNDNKTTEVIKQFDNEAGDVTKGANTCIKKGIRHYVVTMTDGVQFDVIITHMNTYSDSGSDHINAQHGQLTEVANYINGIIGNGRPIIFMGDTNCRYTRHDFQTYFWGKLASGLEAHDPWIDFQWNGIPPTYPSKSLMVSDATGTDPDLDIICENTQKGEVVDKIIYINNPNSNTTITATSYLRDMSYVDSSNNKLADHMPIVVEFEYENVVTVK